MDFPGTYRVVFTRTVRQRVVIEVDADNSEDAKAKATRELLQGDPPLWQNDQIGFVHPKQVQRVKE